MDAHCAQRCTWQREHEFDGIREPTLRQVKHGSLRVVHLQENLESRCAEPTRGTDGPIEGSPFRTDRAVCFHFPRVRSEDRSSVGRKKNARTQSLEFFEGLVMPTAEFRPFRKLVLRAGRVHFSAESNDFTLQFALFASIFRERRRKAKVENP